MSGVTAQEMLEKFLKDVRDMAESINKIIEEFNEVINIEALYDTETNMITDYWAHGHVNAVVFVINIERNFQIGEDFVELTKLVEHKHWRSMFTQQKEGGAYRLIFDEVDPEYHASFPVTVLNISKIKRATEESDEPMDLPF